MTRATVIKAAMGMMTIREIRVTTTERVAAMIKRSPSVKALGRAGIGDVGEWTTTKECVHQV